MCSGRRECRVRDALSIQTKPSVLRIVLRHWKSPRNHLGAEMIVPASLVLVGIIFPRGLGTLEICVVEDALTMGL